MGPAYRRCKYCGRPVVWVTTEDGKRMPVDPMPTPAGNVIAVDHGDVRKARVLTTAMRTQLGDDNQPRYLPHFATCKKLPGGRHRTERSSSDADGAS